MTRPRFGLALGNSNIRPPVLQRPSKRGGSGTFALTNTQDPSLFPTVPPESKFDSGVPKIGGSEGGFIGLIVGLAVLILICACAVFYLLHTRPHGGRSGNKNYPSSSFAPASSGLFASRRKRNAGWIQQQNNEFDYDSAEDEDLVNKNRSKRSSRYGDGGTGYTGQPMQDARLNMSGSVVPAGAAVDAYTDPFDPSKLPESVHKQQVPIPTTSRDSAGQSYNNTSTSTHKQSPTTPTFEGGTKFREGL